jgi:hypothetical protein
MAPINAPYQDMEGGQSLLVATPSSPKYSMLVKVLCAVAVAATVGIAYTSGAHSVGQGAVTNFASFSDVDANILRSMNMQGAAYGADEEDEDAKDGLWDQVRAKRRRERKARRQPTNAANRRADGDINDDDEDEDDKDAKDGLWDQVRRARKAKRQPTIAANRRAYGDINDDDEDDEDAYGQADEDDEDDEDAYGRVKKGKKSEKVRCSCKKTKKATKIAAYGVEEESEDVDDDDYDDEDAYGGLGKKKGRYVSVKKLCKLYCKVRKISKLKAAKK